MSSNLRVALAGCGDISAMHFDAIQANPDATLVAVCDTDTDVASAVAVRLHCTPYTDLEQLIDVERPDVVHICTPHHTHAELAILCLRRDVNVLMEKPLATTISDGEAVIAAAEASKALIGVCFQNRYNATARALRQTIDRGLVGPLKGGRASMTWFRDRSYYQRRPWRGTWSGGGGGVLINQAIHSLDLLQWFLGPVTDVRGFAVRLSPFEGVEIEDTACMHLGHRGGASSIFYASNGYVDNAPVVLELVAEHGTIRLDSDLTVYHADGRQEIVAEAESSAGPRAYWGASHHRLIDDFYRHVAENRPFWIDATEAMRTLRIIKSVYAQSGLPSP